MKRIIVCILLFAIVFSMFACAPKQGDDTVASFGEVNFNNDYPGNPEIWASDDKLFYCQDGFYNMGAYWHCDGKTVKLFEEHELDRSFYEIFPSGRYLYFETYEYEEPGCDLWRYDLDVNTYTKVGNFPFTNRWAVVGEYYIYQGSQGEGDLRKYPLFIYNMTDGSTTQICEDTVEFGLVAGELRYITYTDSYQLFEYDYEEGSSALLGSFSCEYGDDGYNIYNFTADRMVMLNWSREHERKLVVHTISTGSTDVYTLPKGIQDLVACDRYAYAVLYDEQTNTSSAVPAEENGVYRIDLSDGSYEVVVENADDQTKIYVESDDRIYIIERKMTLILSRRYVWRLDVSTGEKKEITVI